MDVLDFRPTQISAEGSGHTINLRSEGIVRIQAQQLGTPIPISHAYIKLGCTMALNNFIFRYRLDFVQTVGRTICTLLPMRHPLCLQWHPPAWWLAGPSHGWHQRLAPNTYSLESHCRNRKNLSLSGSNYSKVPQGTLVPQSMRNSA